VAAHALSVCAFPFLLKTGGLLTAGFYFYFQKNVNLRQNDE
jgi:hypothetical protein